MRQKDKDNLIRSVPVYFICLLLLAVIAVQYVHTPRPKSEPLRRSIAKYFENGQTPSHFLTLDDVINDRSTWQLALADSVGKKVEDFEFRDIECNSRRLSDFAGSPVMLIVWATWSPACTMQFEHLQELRRRHPGLVIVAFSTESEDTLMQHLEQTRTTLMLVRQQEPLPGVLADIRDIPSCFFVDPQGKLFLAAKGLMPVKHADAIIKFMEPKSHEQPLK